MSALPFPPDPSPIRFSFKAIRVRQPIGDIFIASLAAALIQKITFFDVRRVLRDERDVERYLGIQRPLNPKRVDDLKSYVRFIDATFPTSIIVAIESDYVTFDDATSELTISNVREGETQTSTAISNLARVIDGQHRIAGLEGVEFTFDVIVSIFVGSDISDQAYVFATVNLEQTKVSKSLAYDLFDLAQTRSPFRTCHNIAVVLDKFESSPFYQRIKRLGVARPDRPMETITQATFVNGLIGYISDDPKKDRDVLIRGSALAKVSGQENIRLPLRNLFIDGDDVTIGKIYEQFFVAIREKWRDAWELVRPGMILNRTNGYRALSSIFGRLYHAVARPGQIAAWSDYMVLLERVPGDSDQFNVDNFPPGTSGESALRRFFLENIFRGEKLV
jgi:DGQHR domain-containing protein